VIDALTLTLKMEGLIPALESAHAFAQAFKEAPALSEDDIILINQSGRGTRIFSPSPMPSKTPTGRTFIQEKAEAYRA
jgi:tryptophan synthase beta chain